MSQINIIEKEKMQKKNAQKCFFYFENEVTLSTNKRINNKK